MKDILGRELKDGDMCIGMAIGRNSHGMHIGVFKGSSVVYLSRSELSVYKSCTSNTYLIENPTEQELVIKEKVQKILEEEENERKRKASLKTIPLSKLEVGGIYKDTQDCLYLYLGKRTVTFESPYKEECEKKYGNCFVCVPSINFTTDESIKNFLLHINTYRGQHNINVLKSNKRLTEMVKKIDLEFPLVKTTTDRYARHGEVYKLKVE